VRRLEQEISAVGEAEDAAGFQPGDQIGDKMHIGAGGQLQRDVVLVENRLQGLNMLADAGAGVLIVAGHDVGGAGGDGDAVGHRAPRHGQRQVDVRRASSMPGRIWQCRSIT